MTFLPKQVEEAGKKADEALSTLEGGKEGNTDPAPKDPDKPTDKTPDASPQPDSLDHKFKVLQGKYNKEVDQVRNTLTAENTRLKDELSQMTLRMTDLQKSMNQLREQLAAKPAEPAKPVSVLTDEDRSVLEREDITPEVLGVIEKLIDGKVTASTKPLAERVDRTESTVNEHKSLTFADKVMAGVKEKSGHTFEEINSSPDFAKWLDQEIPQAGITRRQAGDTSSKRGDVNRFVQLYVDFVNETGFGKAPTPPADPLESEIEPEGSSATSTPMVTQQQGHVYTPAEIEKFYTDVAIGRYKGRENEANAIDETIKTQEADRFGYKK